MIFTKAFFNFYPALRRRFYLIYNKVYFNACGIKYGRKMKVYDKVYISGKGKVSIGDELFFSSGDSINPICRNIRGAIYTVTPESCIKIGNRVGISSACLWAQDKITIGNDVNIGGDCLILDTDAHPHDYQQRRNAYRQEVDRKTYLESVPSAPITIDDDVWIGARCLILKGVHIGARSIIAAGSIVINDIPSDCIAGGNPCKVIRHL